MTSRGLIKGLQIGSLIFVFLITYSTIISTDTDDISCANGIKSILNPLLN